MSAMAHRGVHHLGLATHDMEATIEFYQDKLGFPLRVADIIQPEGGGSIRHAFLDVGNGEMVAFMECNDVPGVSPDFDAGINKGLGIRGGLIHFAFKADSLEELEARREHLVSKGIEVTDLVDHEWSMSIYFRDPNGLQLEYCTTTETEFGASHLEDSRSDAWSALSRTD